MFGLPNPAFIKHVTVEKYLELAQSLRLSRGQGERMASELRTLRQQLAYTSGAHDKLQRHHAAESRNRKSAEDQLDWQARQAKTLQKSVACAQEQEDALKSELAQLRASESRLQNTAERQREQLAQLRSDHEKLVSLLALQRKQMQVLGTLSCAQCAIKAKEIGAVRDFFQKEAFQR
mmetsp:Transcript_18193/g.34152  ORF Transcript_18193/g.34152 Transcript_18193/m.34152 type:complete len:177 (+) Transcript_18193:118-648(+)